MVMLKGKGPRWRGASLRNTIVESAYRGTWRTQVWPGTMYKVPNPLKKKHQELFKYVNLLIKYQAPGTQQILMEATKGTALMPRDLAVAAMYGRLFMIQRPDGRKIYSMANMQDVSFSLDSIGQLRGQMLYRSDTYWTYIPPGEPNEVLTWDPTTDLPAWQPKTGGGFNWWFAPPLSSWFTLVSGDATNLVMTDDSDSGLLLAGGTPVAGQKIRAAVVPISNKTADWALTIRLDAILSTSANRSYGLMMQDSITGKNVVFALASTGQLVVARNNSLSSANSTLTTLTMRNQVFWLRVRHASNVLYFDASGDGKNWWQFYSYPDASFLTNHPDRLGPYVYYDSAVVGDVNLNVQYWDADNL